MVKSKKGKAVFAILFSAMAMTAHADQESSVEKSVEAWTKFCRQSVNVKNRLGQGGHRPTEASIKEGITTLISFGMVDRLGKLRPKEACLTLAASAETTIPVIVIFKPKTTVSSQRVTMLSQSGKALFDRLNELNIGYSGAGFLDQHYAASTPDNPYPRRDRKNRIRITAMRGANQPRDFSVGLTNHCLVGIDSAPFSQFLRGLPNELQQTLPDEDFAWLEANGDAMSFWHEVGHCEASPVVASGVRRGNEGHSRSSSLDSCNTPTNNQYADQPSVVYTEQEKRRILNVVEQDRSNLNGAQLPKSTPDPWIIMDLSKEVLADDFAYKAFKARFPHATEPCQSAPTLNPWGRFRLLMSLYSPRPSRMNWIMPYLNRSQTSDQRRKLLADAWDGLRQVAFGDYGKIPRAGELQGNSYQGDRYMRVPSETPDPSRSEKWANWIRYWVNADQ
ncbi:hypothetical protein EZI54_07490 [Marinobacter halodurans]|uniref:Uncharacterized protein n=1 Tax=Marinobacter halodurans TaxID=2528979 RepID=A0ABY1ZPH3_9GAMM|nr:hypothetical protein [Marinobacter halodurans]TBW57495.1 hypothetical protein EZI54_07490 [Marinobacter halodurans]